MSCAACGYEERAPLSWKWAAYFPMQPLSQNEYKGMHPRTYRHHRMAWENWVMVSAGRVAKAKENALRRVWFWRLMGARQRPFDRGNLVGGLKPLLDAVVKVGLVYDDAPKHCQDYYPAQVRADGCDAEMLAILAGAPVYYPALYDSKLGGVLMRIEELSA